jgi:hypothetical protein
MKKTINIKIPISYTVLVEFTNRPPMGFTSFCREDANTFRKRYPKGKVLKPCNSIVKTSSLLLNY